MKDMKIRVKSEEHSEAIQLKLYSMGHNWIDDYEYGIETKYTHARFKNWPCLYLDRGFIRMSGWVEELWELDPAPEYVFEDGEFKEVQS